MQRLDGWIPQDVAKEPSQLRLWARAAAGRGGGVLEAGPGLTAFKGPSLPPSAGATSSRAGTWGPSPKWATKQKDRLGSAGCQQARRDSGP